MDQRLIYRIFNVFSPNEALPPKDPRYVECSEQRGSVKLRQIMESNIRRSTDPSSQLLSAYRGCGKTTELLRLQDHLLQTEPRYAAIYCEADQYLDLSDVEYTDVLLALVQQLASAMREQEINLDLGRFQSFLDELARVLAMDSAIHEPYAPSDLAELFFDLKQNPNRRSLVRQHLRPRATAFLDAVNEVFRNAEHGLRARGFRGLVMIVDNLDRIFRTMQPGTDRTSHDLLFVDASDYLSRVGCHVIYTVPPTLVHSPSGAQLGHLYGTPPYVLPMIQVKTRANEPYATGMESLEEVVRRRLGATGTSLEVAFDGPATIERLCAVSGGHLRSLMTFARSAVNYVDDLPIDIEAVEQSVRDMRDTYARSIRSRAHWQLLSSVAKTKQMPETEDALGMLDSLAVLGYRDAQGPWYDVNPVLQEAQPLAE